MNAYRRGRRQEVSMHATASRALDCFQRIEDSTAQGCSAEALQDIVGNLMVLLAWLEEEEDSGAGGSGVANDRCRSVITQCLLRAGVPSSSLAPAVEMVRMTLARESRAGDDDGEFALPALGDQD